MGMALKKSRRKPDQEYVLKFIAKVYRKKMRDDRPGGKPRLRTSAFGIIV